MNDSHSSNLYSMYYYYLSTLDYGTTCSNDDIGGLPKKPILGSTTDLQIRSIQDLFVSCYRS